MHAGTARIRAGALVALAAAALGGAAATAQAAVPAVSTGSAAKVAPQSATLRGSVNPKGKAAVYYFQYGLSKAYGTQTPEVGAGAGTKSVAAHADVLGLTPAKTYHFRIVARNADGTVLGGDKTFKTKPQPLGFSLAATPNPVTFGDDVILQGVLSGTGNSGRQVALQGNVFPYIGGFKTIGNPQVTGATGAFSFPLLNAITNTQYRVVTAAGTKVTSSVVALGVAVDVSTRASAHRVRKGHRVRFSGTVHPAKRGSLFAVQRRDRHGNWITLAGGTSKGGAAGFSRYERPVKIRHSGDYRVFVGVADGYQVSGIGRTVHITAHS